MNIQTNASLAREKQRNSPEMFEFKSKIEQFLETTKASDCVKYWITSDLGKMTNMPYYRCNKLGKRPAHQPKSNEVIKEYMIVFFKYYAQDKNNLNFIKKLLMWLKRNQCQYLRKLSKKPVKQKKEQI